MHELPVTQSILEIALRHALAAQAKRILTLHITIGQLASIVDDSVQFYWEFISKDTPAEGSRLIFKRIPAELLCQDCGTRYFLGDSELSCPQCAGIQVKILSGKEFFLESIDVE